MKYKIDEDEMYDFIKQWLKKYREISATICKNDGELHFENITEGTEEKVKVPPEKCEVGEPIGYIHTHNEEKGISDVDIFEYLQASLRNRTKFPRLDCVVYPVYKNKRMNEVRIECDYVNKIHEKDIKEIPLFGKERDEENIDFIKYGSPYSIRGTFHTLGFVSDMNSIREKLRKENKVRTDNEVVAKVLWEDDRPCALDIDDIYLDFGGENELV